MNLRSRIQSLELRLRTGGENVEKRIDDVIQQMRLSVGGTPSWLPTPRWKPLREHPVQARLWADPLRFKAVPAGRRSGKTEIAKRYIIMEALKRAGWYVCAAPTHAQATRIYWDDLVAMIPKDLVSKKSLGGRSIWLVNGSQIQVMGLDVPERIEGKPLAGVVLDEYANMSEAVWANHVRPALADSKGWAWCIGVPEGRNHYFDLCENAKKLKDWGFYTWWSEDILDAEEVEAIKATLDEQTYEQEMRASFSVFKGRIYHAFRRELHVKPCFYNANRPLVFCFDFNVEPGVCAILQEQDGLTKIIDEVWIPRDSNTPTVCRKLIEDWEFHEGEIHLYGDPAGGARSTKSERGSDWDIIKQHLRPVFKERVFDKVSRSAPLERQRVNAVNTRFKTADGKIHCLIDPRCKKIIEDFEAVCAKEGTNGEIDKSNKKITHLSDAIGYYIHSKFPLQVGAKRVQESAL